MFQKHKAVLQNATNRNFSANPMDGYNRVIANPLYFSQEQQHNGDNQRPSTSGVNINSFQNNFKDMFQTTASTSHNNENFPRSTGNWNTYQNNSIYRNVANSNNYANYQQSITNSVSKYNNPATPSSNYSSNSIYFPHTPKQQQFRKPLPATSSLSLTAINNRFNHGKQDSVNMEDISEKSTVVPEVVQYKRNENEKIRLLTGTIEKVIEWHKIYKINLCYYEVIAPIISIQEGTVRMQKIMLLRDSKGPILQVLHYTMDHINIEDFFVGQMLRCVGHMVGVNVMHAVSIRQASPDEVANLRRMCYIGDHAIKKALMNK